MSGRFPLHSRPQCGPSSVRLRVRSLSASMLARTPRRRGGGAEGQRGAVSAAMTRSMRGRTGRFLLFPVLLRLERGLTEAASPKRWGPRSLRRRPLNCMRVRFPFASAALTCRYSGARTTRTSDRRIMSLRALVLMPWRAGPSRSRGRLQPGRDVLCVLCAPVRYTVGSSEASRLSAPITRYALGPLGPSEIRRLLLAALSRLRPYPGCAVG